MPNRPSSQSLLLFTELYPPAIGGSAVLLQNVYERCSGVDVVVLTTNSRPKGRLGGSVIAIQASPISTGHWGIVRGLTHHIRNAAILGLRARSMSPAVVVHCGRAIPEGIAALIARTAGGPRYACWVHGEDLATARTSRELTWITSQVLRRSAVVFANSLNTKSHAEGFGVSPEKVVVTYPGVDCDRFTPSIDGADVRSRHGVSGGPVVLSVGRLQARKGHDTALRAVAAVRYRWPDLRYLIVGSGEQNERLKALSSALGIDDCVTFVGDVTDEMLPQYFAAADVFLLPNRVEGGDFEGFGIVFLEAAAAARPVIGGASGGVIEAVEDGRTGLLVDGASVTAVSDALNRLLSDPPLCRDMGIAGRRRAETFTWQKAADTVGSIHRRLLESAASTKRPL